MDISKNVQIGRNKNTWTRMSLFQVIGIVRFKHAWNYNSVQKPVDWLTYPKITFYAMGD